MAIIFLNLLNPIFLLSKLVDLVVFILFFAINHSKNYHSKFTKQLSKLKIGLAQETEETKVMLDVYRRFLNGEITKEELKEANDQFVDIIKGLGLGTLLILPFSPITLPIIIKLSQKLGLEIMPSSFRKKNSQHD